MAARHTSPLSIDGPAPVVVGTACRYAARAAHAVPALENGS
ncbi:hypothetical protein [Streptomyces griseoviridis]|uniref:Uncharacterized protein n=1 Tax=Streptomyces griseoviridis TaxID=45398 RepID=A0ABT9LQ68_STRGD|nr:hypothetical protein [Streptomyces griseoviridis]MDP9685674.1 hypothetical protein [Streptomyces griseoviridis]